MESVQRATTRLALDSDVAVTNRVDDRVSSRSTQDCRRAWAVQVDRWNTRSSSQAVEEVLSSTFKGHGWDAA